MSAAAVEQVLVRNGLLTAFAAVGLTMALSYWASARLTRGRIHGSAIAILAGLACAALAGGKQGAADIPVLSGLGLMGGAMLRDLAIVATAFGVRLEEFMRGGLAGAVALIAGLTVSFAAGGVVQQTHKSCNSLLRSKRLIRCKVLACGLSEQHFLGKNVKSPFPCPTPDALSHVRNAKHRPTCR